MPNFRVEQARTQSLTALDRIRTVFPDVPDCADAVFLSADRREGLGFVGLPFPAPVCPHLPADAELGPWLHAQSGSLLFCVETKTFSLSNTSGKLPLPESMEERLHYKPTNTLETNDCKSATDETTR